MEEDSSCSSSSGSGNDKPKTHSKSTSTEDSLGVSTTSSTWTIWPSDRVEAVVDKLNGNQEEAKDPGELQSGDTEDKHENDRCNLAVDDSQADDISDGISIISDCESTDRISPHPFLRDTLADLNFNLPSTPLRLSSRDVEGLLPPLPPLPPPPPPPHRQRRHKHTETEPEWKLLQHETKLEALYRMYPLMQNSLTAIFYVCATLAVLGFIGRLQHPEWPGLGNDKPIAELERRLGELEMSNNLMRAEIDIMSKQLQYLSSGQGPAFDPDGVIYYRNAYGQSPEQAGMGIGRPGKKYKKFKAWPGLGDSMEPLDITKEDLKKPHKCRDGQYVQVASMCLESPLSAPESLVDEIGDAVHDVLQQSQAFRNFEKVTEKLGTLGTGGVDAEGDASSTTEAKAFQADGKQQATGNGNPHKQPKPKVDRYHDKYSPNVSKDRYNDKYNPNHSHEGKRDNSRGRSKEDDRSKEHNNNHKRYNDDASMKRERYNKNGKNQRHHANSGERDESDGSGEWHEKRMQQREQSRHKHDQKRKDNNNWYIERGDGREQARSSEAGR